MIFIAFNLDDFHRQHKDACTRVSLRFINLKNFESAKQFIKDHYKGAWAIVPKKTFDKGIVHARNDG